MRRLALVLAFVSLMACSGRQARDWNDRGIAHSEKGDHAAAVKAFAEAVRLDPGVSAYHYNLGRSYVLMRHYDVAETHLREALRIDPSNVEASRLLSISVARIQSRGLP